MTRFRSPAPPYVGPPANYSGLNNRPIRRVVIHSAVMPCEPGRARQLGQMNRSGSTGGSWHYATDPAETVQCSYDSVVCWHAPPNRGTLGIEMADWPGPVPGMKRGTRAWAAARRAWRWAKPAQRRMLRRTARLAAELCLAEGLPVRYVTARMMRSNPDAEGITTHAATSKAFRQSDHWDPGFWPRPLFMRHARRHAKALRAATRK